MATLYMVATPIGNLGDISPRALATLGEADVIAAESVTRARKLLSRFNLAGKRVISSRESNRDNSAAGIVALLDAGKNVAYISDAGTPGVSDPGSLLARRSLEAGHAISPLPGPCALAAALSVSGLDSGPLIFLGFPPAKAGPRQRLFAQAAESGWAMALYEAPHRLAETTADLAAALGERGVLLARELSKLHEEVRRATLNQLAAWAAENEVKGEICLVVDPGVKACVGADRVDELIRQGLASGEESPSRLAARLAGELGENKGRIYDRLMTIKAEEEADD